MADGPLWHVQVDGALQQSIDVLILLPEDSAFRFL
jgi:hypothetical protein